MKMTTKPKTRKPPPMFTKAGRKWIDEKCDETEKEHKIWEAAAEERRKSAEMMEGRLTELDLADKLETMKRRCSGLEAAVISIEYGADSEGVAQIATDVADQMKALVEEFGAELELRTAGEKSGEDKMPGR
jgi:hypothetical protein